MAARFAPPPPACAHYPKATMANSVQSEVDAIVQKLKALAKDFRPAEMRRIMRPAAKMVAREIAAAAPTATRTVYRYDTPKLNGNMRAPKRSGRIVAQYEPGNLGKSIGVLTFRRSTSLWIGPRAGRKSRGDDGWYAKFVEFGVPSRGIPAQPFIRNTWDRVKSTAFKMVESEVEKTIKKYQR